MDRYQITSKGLIDTHHPLDNGQYLVIHQLDRKISEIRAMMVLRESIINGGLADLTHVELATEMVQALTYHKMDLFLLIERGYDDPSIDKWLHNRESCAEGACTTLHQVCRNYVDRHFTYPLGSVSLSRRLTAMFGCVWTTEGKDCSFPINIFKRFNPMQSYLLFSTLIQEYGGIDPNLLLITPGEFGAFAEARIQLINMMIDEIQLLYGVDSQWSALG